MILFRCVSSAWLEYMPVTHGVTGSSPVRTAAIAFLSGRLCCFYAYLTLIRSPSGQGYSDFILIKLRKSSPVRTATTAFLLGRLCCFYAYLTLTRSPSGQGYSDSILIKLRKSSPVRTATTAFLSGRLCCFYAFLTLTGFSIIR